MKRLLVATLAAFTACSFAEHRSSASAYLTSSFDLGAESVGAGFKGHNCAAVANRLLPSRLVRTEFETDAEYESQAAQAIEALSPLVNAAHDATLAFPIRDTTLLAEFDYDAERRTASLRLNDIALLVQSLSLEAQVQLRLRKGLSPHVFVLQTVSEARRPFMGQNAFGVRVRAESVRRKVCGVAPMLSYRDLVYGARVEVPLDPEPAKDAKAHLGIILLGRPAPPFFMKGDHYSPATVDGPIELHTDGDVVPLDLSELWYFNTRTGAVIAKAKFKS